jgi:hypothetical protein
MIIFKAKIPGLEIFSGFAVIKEAFSIIVRYRGQIQI